MPIILFILLLVLAPFVYFIGFNNIKPSELFGLSLDIQAPEIGMILKGVHLIEKKGNETVVDLFSTQAEISKESDFITMINVDARIIGRCENHKGKKLTIMSVYWTFEYN